MDIEPINQIVINSATTHTNSRHTLYEIIQVEDLERDE